MRQKTQPFIGLAVNKKNGKVQLDVHQGLIKQGTYSLVILATLMIYFSTHWSREKIILGLIPGGTEFLRT